MTEVINKITGAKYISNISTSKLHWLDLIVKENPEFFEGYNMGSFIFFPLDGGY